MHTPDLKSLQLFAAVCDAGNIKRAALQAHIEPSAVSKRMSQLEERFGVKLLHRARHGVAPTVAGEAVLEHTRSLMHILQRIEADVQAFAAGVQGKVRIVASASAIAESLLDDIADFMREPAHQAIQVEVEEANSQGVVRAVRDGSAALGVCWDQVEARDLHQIPYRHDDLVLAVPRHHPLAKHDSLYLADALPYPFVGLPPSSAVTRMLDRAAAEHNTAVRWRVVVSNFDAAVRVILAGLAITVLPREVMGVFAGADQLSIIALRDDWTRRRFAVYLREPGLLPPAARSMVDFLGARLVTNPE